MSEKKKAPKTLDLKPSLSTRSPAAPQGGADFIEYLPQSQHVLGLVKKGSKVSHYRIGDRIGVGGMGVVYRAEDRRSSDPVAIKFLISSPEETEKKMRRFRQEASIISKLDHDAIVEVSELDSEKGLNFMVMELFLGPYDKPVNLKDYAAEFGAANNILDAADTRQIMLVLLDAIGYAHQNGVVHCDLKPENILFQSRGMEGDYWNAHLKLTDFGLAKVIGEEVIHQSVTQSLNRMEMGATMTSDAMSLLGTYDYMSPEQRRGEPATFASDLYAIGLMIYRFLTGQSELGLHKPSELCDGLDPAWDAIILKALQEDPARRYTSADELSQALEQLGD